MESERLIFRIMYDEDKDDFYEIFSSEKVGAFIKPMTRQQVENYFEKRKSKPVNPYSFAVVLKETGKMIGTIGLKEKEPKIGTLSYVFNDKFWNNGYCSESIKFILENAKKWGFKEILADCEETNIKSQHLLEKFNFKFTKTNEEEILNYKTGKPTTFYYYSLPLIKNCLKNNTK